MKKYLITTFTIMIIIAISATIANFVIYPNDSSIPSKSITKCIASKSILYFSESCIHCKKQERMFGENYQYLNIVDCKKEPKKCINAGITATPTWVINGQQLPGVRSIEKLKEVTNCG